MHSKRHAINRDRMWCLHHLISKQNDESERSVSIKECVKECQHPHEGSIRIFLPTYTNIDDYIPKYLKEKFRGVIIPHSCKIIVKYKKGEERPTFAYSFSFFEETSKLSSSTNSFKDVTFPIKRYQSSNKIIEQDEAMRCCDGPCSQMRNIRDLWQFGRCDHAICSMCLANAPLANAPDGSLVCCNPNCFAYNLMAISPSVKFPHESFKMINNSDQQKSKHRRSGRRDNNVVKMTNSLNRTSTKASSNADDITDECVKEMIVVNMIILENGTYQTIRRHRISEEIGSTCTIGKAVASMASANCSKILEHGKVFLSKGIQYRNSQLLRINLDKYGNTKLNKFKNNSGVLNFIVDFTGQLH